MLKKLSFRFKSLNTNMKILAVLTLLIPLFLATNLFQNCNRFRTLNSLQEIDSGELYVLNYYGDYKFEKFLKQGFENYSELYRFLNKNLLSSFKTFSAIDTSDNCSAFSASNTAGDPILARNLDISGRHPAVLLFSKPSKGYASVSIVEMTALGYSDNAEDLKYMLGSYKGRRQLLASPYMPRDGMNEYGLVVATLNAPKQPPQKDPNKISLGRWQVVRLLLDHARNVDEAAGLLERFNAFDGQVHYLISDSSGKSVVAEYIDGKLALQYREGSYQSVTNFLLSHPDKIGTGKDRYLDMNTILQYFNGRVPEEEALKILNIVSQPTTAWSVVYNQRNYSISLVMRNRFDRVNKFILKKSGHNFILVK